MEQTKLIQLLKCFSDKEIKQFDSFLESPYFNKNELLLRFYRVLSPYHPKMESVKLAKEKVYAKLYASRTYKDKTMRNLTSLLYQLATEFIGYENLKNDVLELNRQKYLWLAEKGNEKLRGHAVEYSEKLLEQHVARDSRFYLHRWLADFNKFEYQADQFKDLEHKLERESDLGTHLHSLNRYYLIKGLETQLYILSVSYNHDRQFDQTFFNDIETLAQKYIERGDIVIDLYYNLVQLEKTGEKRYYTTLKAKFLANDPSISEILMKEIYISLVSYLSKKILTENKRQTAVDLMEIFRFVIKLELMYYKGEVSYHFFQSAVHTAIKVEQLNWAEEFIEIYKPKLALRYQEEVYNYCKAFVLFERKKFDGALQLALRVNTTIYSNKMDIKGLMTRIYYELGLFDQLEVVLDSYKYNIAEGAIPPMFMEGYSNFVKSMRKLVALKQNYSREGHSKLLLHFKRTQRLHAQLWFIAKMKELEKR